MLPEMSTLSTALFPILLKPPSSSSKLAETLLLPIPLPLVPESDESSSKEESGERLVFPILLNALELVRDAVNPCTNETIICMNRLIKLPSRLTLCKFDPASTFIADTSTARPTHIIPRRTTSFMMNRQYFQYYLRVLCSIFYN
uniref:Uncharacterized protein n=1 Tax=Cacopsylla melanoneura TaxID=428564 RepID=A0A8D8Q118_9HEMI